MAKKNIQADMWSYNDLMIAWEIAGRPQNISAIGRMLKNCEEDALEPFIVKLSVPTLYGLAKVQTKRDNRLLAVVAFLPHMVSVDDDRARDNSKIHTMYALSLRQTVARNKKAPTTLLEALSVDADRKVRSCVAQNPVTPQGILERLAKDPEHSVRVQVARNKNTPIGVLTTLISDRRAIVRGAVAWNFNTTETMFARLFEDKTVVVKTHLARSIYVPGNILEKLATSEHATIRKEVASNSYAPKQLLEKLSQDPNSLVASYANYSLHHHFYGR